MITEKYGVQVWTGSDWFGIWTSASFCKCGDEALGYIEQEIYWPAKWLSNTQRISSTM
jgi:hypothetical protein